MRTTFISRSGTQVTANVDGIDLPVSLATEEQAHLYELVLTGKVNNSSLEFAKSLIKARTPSRQPGGQMYWVVKLIQGATGSQPTMLQVDFSKVRAMFANARQHLKYPKITLLMDEADVRSGVRFSVDRRGRNCVWMNDAASSFGATYGSIDLDTGIISLRSAGRQVESSLMTLIKAFSAAPLVMAIRHGKLTGHCCFCRLPLSDERSLKAGYGEICAGHYHLPWGKHVGSPLTAMGDWALDGGKHVHQEVV